MTRPDGNMVSLVLRQGRDQALDTRDEMVLLRCTCKHGEKDLRGGAHGLREGVINDPKLAYDKIHAVDVGVNPEGPRRRYDRYCLGTVRQSSLNRGRRSNGVEEEERGHGGPTVFSVNTPHHDDRLHGSGRGALTYVGTA